MRNRSDRWGSRRKLTFDGGRDVLFRYFLRWSADNGSGQTGRQIDRKHSPLMPETYCCCYDCFSSFDDEHQNTAGWLGNRAADRTHIRWLDWSIIGKSRSACSFALYTLSTSAFFNSDLTLSFLLSTRSPIRKENSRWLQVNGSSHRVSASTNICEQWRGSTLSHSLNVVVVVSMIISYHQAVDKNDWGEINIFSECFDFYHQFQTNRNKDAQPLFKAINPSINERERKPKGS